MIVIPGTLPSLNEIVKAAKISPYAYSAMKKEYTDVVAMGTHIARAKPITRANFIITYVCPNKRKDKDNISGGGDKFIFDGLQAAGIISNDGWKQIGDVTHRFSVDKDNPRIEVQIIEIEEETA